MSMTAVVFNGPFDIGVAKRPKPQIVEPDNAIVRVELAGICGSELHMYRGHQQTATGHIMGHEFIGVVEKVGNEVSLFAPGDEVVSIFSPVWGLTNRCVQGVAFGTQLLNGGQAEYVRVPFADGTLQHVPHGLDRRLLIMMCDIFPTGFYGACRAIEGLQSQYDSRLTSFSLNQPNGYGATLRASSVSLNDGNGKVSRELADSVLVCVGCGPVGICAIATARSQGIKTIFAVDSMDDRLEEAEHLGALPLMLGRDDVNTRIMEATDGRGADAVIEVVGNKAALRSAFDLLRPCGVLSSVGFHQRELPFTGLECYQKNITVNFGRVPVRNVFQDALECLKENQGKMQNYVTHKFDLKEAAKGYELFEQRKARKVILRVA